MHNAGLEWALPFCVLLSLGCSTEGGTKKLGDTCERGAECESNRCDELVCKSNSPTEVGAMCLHPLECLSENCSAQGICGLGLRPLGDMCNEDLQCTTGGCVQGVCVSYTFPDQGAADHANSSDARVDTSLPDNSVPRPDLPRDHTSSTSDSTVDSVSPVDSTVDTATPIDSTVDTTSPDAPISSGSCPCKAIFDTHYISLNALLWPSCTTAESANNLDGIFPITQRIDARYIDNTSAVWVMIASNSSTSPKIADRNMCTVRTTHDALVAGPIPVSDEDHMACVNDIKEREVICQGCNWLQDPCP
ncbi:MAG: hypothetical protein JRH20_05535 [Deltaproteobacteria bacterium]|nr:hypothetical protein [Deltaproteobacteria bacterium]